VPAEIKNNFSRKNHREIQTSRIQLNNSCLASGKDHHCPWVLYLVKPWEIFRVIQYLR